MRAKFINENVTDILKPKNKEEMDAAFREKVHMSWDKYQYYLKELEATGVEILEPWSWRIYKATIKAYKVYKSNWNIGTTLTKKEAIGMAESHKQYSFDTAPYRIDGDNHEYVSPEEIKKLIARRRMKFKTSPEYSTDKFSNVNDKYDYPEYGEWEEANRDAITARWKQKAEDSKKIDETSK